MSKLIKIKCNANLGKFKKDSIIQVQANNNGVPLDKFWRNRIRDAEVDNCCEIIKDEKKSAKKTEQ